MFSRMKPPSQTRFCSFPWVQVAPNYREKKQKILPNMEIKRWRLCGFHYLFVSHQLLQCHTQANSYFQACQHAQTRWFTAAKPDLTNSVLTAWTIIVKTHTKQWALQLHRQTWALYCFFVLILHIKPQLNTSRMLTVPTHRGTTDSCLRGVWLTWWVSSQPPVCMMSLGCLRRRPAPSGRWRWLG